MLSLGLNGWHIGHLEVAVAIFVLVNDSPRCRFLYCLHLFCHCRLFGTHHVAGVGQLLWPRLATLTGQITLSSWYIFCNGYLLVGLKHYTNNFPLCIHSYSSSMCLNSSSSCLWLYNLFLSGPLDTSQATHHCPWVHICSNLGPFSFHTMQMT